MIVLARHNTFIRSHLSRLLIAVLGLALAGCSADEPVETTTPVEWLSASDTESDRAMLPREFLEFPRDHGPHIDYRTEWWYVTSVLATDSGREYGVQFTLFRSSLTNSQETDNPWRTSQMYMGHLALSDVGRRVHVEAQRIARGHPQLAGVDSEPFHAYIEDWSLRSQTQSFIPLELFGRTGEFEIALELDSTKPIVLQGDEGLSRKSPEHFSYYYSIPRMKTRGKLTIGDEVQSVSGYSWLDREWSNGLLSDRYQGWYWFALSFDDGTDMVFFSLLDRADGSDRNRVATVVDRDRKTSSLDAADWSVTPLRYWKQWPVEWRVNLPERVLHVVPAFDDQEMNTSILYWEGLVQVFEADREVGKGYLELTGYSDGSETDDL